MSSFASSLLCLVLMNVLAAQCQANVLPKGMPLTLPKDATPSPQLMHPPTPPLLLPMDATTPAPPPLLFPEDVENYKILTSNATLLATLRHQQPAEEVSDMLHVTEDQKEDLNVTEKTVKKATESKTLSADEGEKKQQESFSESTTPSAPSAQAELIQPTHQERQSNEHEEQFNRHHYHKPPRHDQDFLKHMRISDTAAIMAGSFAAIAVLGFAGLVMWRQIIERKYGTRERLVTEDTYYTSNDLRHFEL